MKKPIIFLLMIFLMIGLCACRPTALPEGNGTASDVGNSKTEPKPETKQDTEQKSLDAEPDAKAEQTAVKDTEKPAETKQETVKYFVETKDGVEWKVPEEDPALRAEADKILAEQGLNEYLDFCVANDIKYYYKLSETDQFDCTKIIVSLKKCCSKPGKIAPPFEKYIDVVSVKDRTSAKAVEEYEKSQNTGKSDFSQRFHLTVNSSSKKETLQMVKELEKVPYVACVFVAYCN